MVVAPTLLALAYLLSARVRGSGIALCGLVIAGLGFSWLIDPALAPGGASVAGVAGWPALGVSALVGVLGMAGHGQRRRQRKRSDALERSARIREVCDLLAADLAAGLPAGPALAGGVEVWPDWDVVARTDRLGGSAAEAMRSLARLDGAGDLIQVAAAWQLSQRSGAELAAALAEVAAALADAEQTRRVVRSELASARATARLVAALPLATLAMGSGMGDPVSFLITTPIGWLCLIAGLSLALAGLAWLEQIAARVEGEAW